MMYKKDRNPSISRKRYTAWALIIVMIAQLFTPYQAFALTSGPAQPEFSSFEPVSTTNMVNEYSGDFSYNLPVIEIPGPEGSGYALSLSYHSGTSPEEEASWVGYGWTLNPGAITRNKRGFPDDFKGEQVTFHNDVPANWTVSVGAHAGNIELFSIDALDLGVNASLRYNNYKGLCYTAGVGLQVKGVASLGYSVSDGEGNFSYSVNPAKILSGQYESFKKSETDQKDHQKSSWKKKLPNHAFGAAAMVGHLAVGSQYGFLSQNWMSRSTKVHPYAGTSFNITASLEATPSFLPAGSEVGIFGGFSLQKNKASDELPAYGYMYAGDAGTDAIQDYYLEHETPYQKRDKFLATPFSNPDYFSVNGEGLGGGFRLHHRKAGHFSPNPVSSTTTIANVGIEFQGGGNVGAGLDDIEVGTQSLTVSKWNGYDTDSNFDSSKSSQDEPFFFRFKNDIGGNVLFGDLTGAQAAAVVDKAPSLSAFPSTMTVEDYNATQQTGRSGRAAYIGYHTNAEMDETAFNTVKKSYTKDADALTFVSDKSNIGDGIGEFQMTNEDGFTYTFGLPVYARKEESIQYGLKNLTAVQDKYIAYGSLDASNIRSKTGEERPSAYATTHLLTSITSPDYIDRHMDGPSSDDFGGYTKFTYKQIYGTLGDKQNQGIWYNWRIPYTGFYYTRNSLSDFKDDQCAYMSGEKEIYFLDKITTRTHQAVFYTSPRCDGLDAPANNVAADNSAAIGSNALHKLDSIRLYALDPAGLAAPRHLQTVHFQYDYELMHNSPNAFCTDNANQGKLTLKRVWTEYEGTTPAKIAPYEFGYQYVTNGYPATYSSWDNFGNYAASDQNPDYNPTNLDAWGNYQKDGSQRLQDYQNWVNQAPSATFDPAAWQLKSIRLPSGGEIQIQYEQKTYNFVQNRRAMAMVSLHPVHTDDSNSIYYLNVEDLGIAPSAPFTNDLALNQLKTIIERELIIKKEKIYFKFLYSLLDPFPANFDCTSDYLTGYAKIESVGIDNNGIYVKLKGTSNFPDTRSVCRDFVKTSRGGMLTTADCEPQESGLDPSVGPEDVALQLLAFIGTTFSGGTINCKDFNPELSYLRIPVLYPKKGGGVRVKRLLMFDKGLNGKPVLLGNEYVYETRDPNTGEIISSGVASNEPDRIREENALITSIEKREDQGFLEKIFAGKDKEEFEGFIGESLLPSASIGHSRVIIKNIHSGNTNPGFSVKEFFTAYDYPFDKYHPLLGHRGVEITEINQGDKEWLVIPAGLSSYSKTNLWLTQGFSFVQTDFEGKPKRSATYAGSYLNINNEDATALISSEEFNYFEVGEQIPISLGLDYSSQTVLKNPGKEMELIFETKKIEDISLDNSLELDANVGVLPIPIPFVTSFAGYNYAESKLHTHIATKITSYPAIVRSVKRYQDGVASVTRNLAFSPDNCRPVLTRTTDGFHGLNLEQSANHQGYYWKYDFAASPIYPALGQRAYNERRILSSGGFEKQLFGSEYKLVATTSSAILEMERLAAGDLINLKDNLGVYNAGRRVGNLVDLYPVDGTSATGGVSEVHILTSGKANRLNEDAGSLVVYGDDLNVTADPADLAELALRQDFAGYLTASLITGGSIVFPHPLRIRVIENDSSSGCPPCKSCDSVLIQNLGTSTIGTVDYSNFTLYCQHQQPAAIQSAFICPFSCTFKVPRSTIPLLDHFSVNSTTGAFIYHTGDNLIPPQEVSCRACPDLNLKILVSGVIDVAISTYKDDWAIPAALYSTYQITDPTASPYSLGFKGKWRPDAQFVYREKIISGIERPPGTPNTNRIYKDAGTFTMEMFNWVDLAMNDPEKWLQVNQTNLFSPHGQVLEEENIQKVKSVAKYGYSHSMPYLVAQNTDFSAVCFESFENVYNNSMVAGGKAWEEAVAVDLTIATPDPQEAHAGRQSLRLKVFQDVPNVYTPYSKFFYKNITITPQIASQGLQVKFWLKAKNRFGRSLMNSLLQLTAGSTLNKECVKIAQTGEWTLYEAQITPSDFVSAGISAGSSAGLHLRFNLSPSDIGAPNPGVPLPNWYDELWLDDLRIQPFDAQMTCFVYDPSTYRLLTSFDDQHFGLYYQYNAKGELVRKLVETERGVKTVQETQYHTPLKPRNN